jgi:sarcosine oxidase subunit alpha
MTGDFRHPSLGRIDRGQPLRFRFDGQDYQGYRGDTLASALLANGVHQVATSVRLGRPRGIVSAGSEEPSALVQIEWPFPEPMLAAPTVELYDGLVASSLRGQGRLSGDPDPARYDAVHAHCDVLVVGGGPAGLTAAAQASRSGARVILADERPALGGTLRDHPSTVDGQAGDDWVRSVAAALAGAADTRVLTRTTVVGYYDDNYLVAVQRRTNHLGGAAPAHLSRERIWRIRAGRVVLATGAHERPLAFADNDRPGVMLAGSARAYLHGYGVLPGRRAVVFTTNDSAYPAALDLAEAGVEIVAVVDVRPDAADLPAARGCAEQGIAVLGGRVVTGVDGVTRVSAVTVAPHRSAASRRLDADLLLVSGGWSPVLHLYSQAGGRLRHDEETGAFVPDGARQAVEVVGAALRPPAAEPFWLVPGPDYTTHFVDLQRDVTVAEVRRATGAGLRSVEHVKRYTTAGTGADQGKTSGLLTSAVTGHALAAEIAALGMTTFRPPYTPVSFAALAGRDRGQRYDPVRVTALHEWHVAHGARFEDVGQWKRPWYYPRDGEDQHAAVLRECRAARQRVAFMDASTLGKIEVQGPDAATFLDRIYTNMISTLAVGSIRYGVMCRPDGMVFDDGTVARVAPDRFLVTTTTGNAGPVLDWMEEWVQTEWPHLRTYCTSVTEQWVTVALVGPASRPVLAALAPELAVDAASFPFMTWRDAGVAGLAARVCRISFSGELAYEINVRSWDGLALWTAIDEAGRAWDITPYGTETMHVLRAEKGYPIIGQDTDGTVTPQDLGMDWVVSKKKADFLGKRSFSRPDTSRPDRKQLVGLLPQEPATLVPEGAALVSGPRIPAPNLGHVTSSYHSAALGRTFALALVRGGRARIGERLYATVADELVPVTVVGPVCYDPEGARRDG